MIPQPTNRREKKEAKKKVKVSKGSLQFNGFNLETLRPYPHLLKEGEVPFHILAPELKEDFANIEEGLTERIRKEFIEKKFLPTLEHVKRVYEHHC